jgi:tight adherence protein B
MRRLAAFAALCTLSVPVLAGPVVAQTSGDLDIIELEIDDSIVAITVGVPNDLGVEVVSGQNFAIIENGEARQAAVNAIETPLEVMVAIDTSGSMAGEPLVLARAAAIDFVSTLPEGSRVGVVGFGDEAALLAEPSTDRQPAIEVLETLVADGETALNDGVVAGAEAFTPSNARRVMVLLSDGADTVSVTSLQRARAELEAVGAQLYAVALQGSEVDLEHLNSLVSGLGGRRIDASSAADLQAVYAEIGRRLVNQFRLTYVTNAEGPTTLEVRALIDDQIYASVVTVDLPVVSAPEPAATSTTPEPATDEPAEDSAAPSADEPDVVVVPEPSGLAGDLGLWVGAAAAFSTLAVVLILVFTRRPRVTVRTGTRTTLLHRAPALGAASLGSMADRLTGAADRVLERKGRGNALDQALEKADLPIRASEFVVLVAVGAAVVGGLGWRFWGLVTGLVFALAVVLAAVLVVRAAAGRRQKRFADQLEDVMMIMASSLRAGYGLQQALLAVAEETPSPTRDEFRRAVAEVQVGRDLVQALLESAQRSGSPDFEWVVRAIAIHRELGGDLAEILDNVAETIRDRNRVKGQIRALSAEGRMSAVVLTILPFATALLVHVTNPGYIDSLFESTAGTVVAVGSLGLMCLGALWMWRLIRLEY